MPKLKRTQAGFFTDTIKAMARVREVGWRDALLVSLLIASVELAGWALHNRIATAAALAVMLPASLIASFCIVMAAIEARPRPAGFLKYLATWAVMISPALLGVVLIFPMGLALPAWTGWVLTIGLLIYVLFMPILGAWPIAQAVSPRLVGPLRIVRATRGYRGGLIFAWIGFTGVGSRVVPSIYTAREPLVAAGIAAADVVVAFIGLLFSAAVVANAWTYALSADPGLAGDADALPPAAE